MSDPSYPRGKLRPDDKGAVDMSFAIQGDTLVITFPHPVDWIGLGVRDLERLIALLRTKAAQLHEAGA